VVAEALTAEVARGAVVDRVVHDGLAGRAFIQPIQVFIANLSYFSLLLEANLPVLRELSVAWVAQKQYY